MAVQSALVRRGRRSVLDIVRVFRVAVRQISACMSGTVSIAKRSGSKAFTLSRQPHGDGQFLGAGQPQRRRCRQGRRLERSQAGDATVFRSQLFTLRPVQLPIIRRVVNANLAHFVIRSRTREAVLYLRSFLCVRRAHTSCGRAVCAQIHGRIA